MLISINKTFLEIILPALLIDFPFAKLSALANQSKCAAGVVYACIES